MEIQYTVERLLLDESFLDYCRNRNSVYKKKWEQIIEQNPGRLKATEEAKELLFMLSPELSGEEVEKEVNKIKEMIYAQNSGQKVIPEESATVNKNPDTIASRRLRSRKIKKMLLYSIIPAVSLAAVMYVTNAPKKSKAGKSNSLVSASWHNTMGQRKQLMLPDGSIVILNSNSAIAITPAYGQKERVVQLSGEAFFKVAKNVGKPFIVMNDAFSTTALGTSFYVHARRDRKNYSVNLLEGELKLTAPGLSDKTIYLMPGEQAQWQQDQLNFARNGFDTLVLKQWLSGTISFNHTPLRQAVKQLGDWYAVDIEMQRKDSKNPSLTGDYSNASLDDVLKIICFSLSCQYRYSGNKVIIQ